MIWLIVAFPLATLTAGLFFVAWDWLGARARRKINQEIVERELTKVLNAAERERAALPNPERPLDAEAINASIDKLRALGRKPL